jgi:hypothetical protein
MAQRSGDRNLGSGTMRTLFSQPSDSTIKDFVGPSRD